MCISQFYENTVLVRVELFDKLVFEAIFSLSSRNISVQISCLKELSVSWREMVCVRMWESIFVFNISLVYSMFTSTLVVVSLSSLL